MLRPMPHRAAAGRGGKDGPGTLVLPSLPRGSAAATSGPLKHEWSRRRSLGPAAQHPEAWFYRTNTGGEWQPLPNRARRGARLERRVDSRSINLAERKATGRRSTSGTGSSRRRPETDAAPAGTGGAGGRGGDGPGAGPGPALGRAFLLIRSAARSAPAEHAGHADHVGQAINLALESRSRFAVPSPSAGRSGPGGPARSPGQRRPDPPPRRAGRAAFRTGRTRRIRPQNDSSPSTPTRFDIRIGRP